MAFFKKYCKQYGIETSLYDSQVREGMDYSKFDRFISRKIVKENFDGFFLPTDESIGLAVHQIFRLKKVPSDFKIVTLNSSGRAMTNKPPITALGHGVDQIVRKTMDFLIDLAAGKASERVREYIKPEIFYNGTLSEDEQNWAANL